MNRKVQYCVIAAIIALGLARDVLAEQNQSQPTSITIQGEMCKGCVRKMKTKLASVSNIAEIQADITAKTLVIYPVENTELSPRALWEAIEKAGKKPGQLSGPAGTFDAKPDR